MSRSSSQILNLTTILGVVGAFALALPAQAVVMEEGVKIYAAHGEQVANLSHLMSLPKNNQRLDVDAYLPNGYSPYRHASKILFISDNEEEQASSSSPPSAAAAGQEPRRPLISPESIATEVRAIAPPGTEIYQTNLSFGDGPVPSGIKRQVMDNTLPFPFSSSLFDTIMMRRGMCHCDDSQRNCAGIDLRTSGDLPHFLSEVIRVLNRNNPNSVAYLHGNFYGEAPVIEPYAERVHEQVIEQLQEKFTDVEMRMIYVLTIEMRDAFIKIAQKIDTIEQNLASSDLTGEKHSQAIQEKDRLSAELSQIETDKTNYMYRGILIRTKKAPNAANP